MTEGLRACRERAGFAAAPLTGAELAAMPLRPISGALCLAVAAVCPPPRRPPEAKAATGAQVTGQGALAFSVPVRAPRATRPARRTSMTPARTSRAGRR